MIPTPPAPCFDGAGRVVRLGKGLGGGGEGAVYEVDGDPTMVAKVYNAARLATGDMGPKLRAMVAHAPADPTAAAGHMSLAWPRDVLLHQGTVVGYTMPRAPKDAHPLHKLVNPTDRVQIAPGAGWRFMVQVARNLSGAIVAIHDAGHVVDDLNDCNVLVDRCSMVTIVDTDSGQIAVPSGTTYLCPVRKPETTAPEVFRLIAAGNRGPFDPAIDRFALAVHIYSCLMEGWRPFAGVWHGTGTPTPEEKAAQGLFAPDSAPQLTMPPAAPDYGTIPTEIRSLFSRAFVTGATRPADRPSAAEWHSALDALSSKLVDCPNGHQHAPHVSCPWCQRRPTVPKPPPASNPLGAGGRAGPTRVTATTFPPFTPPSPTAPPAPTPQRPPAWVRVLRPRATTRPLRAYRPARPTYMPRPGRAPIPVPVLTPPPTAIPPLPAPPLALSPSPTMPLSNPDLTLNVAQP